MCFVTHELKSSHSFFLFFLGSSGALQEVKMKVVENKECNCMFQDFIFWDITITPTMMCAGGESGKRVCFVSYNSL